jgi:hypothetical protein
MREERWAEAQAMLAKAYRMVPAPTIALLEGRALERMGRLVDAAARYEAAMRAEVGSDSPKAFRNAMKEALAELERLDPRIPRLRIVVTGAAPQSDVIVQLDQRAVAPASLVNPMRVDPGEHVVTASAEGFTAVEQRVQLAEGESKEVVLSFAPAPAGESPASAPPVTQPAEQTPVASTPVDSGPSPALGWTALGIGVAGLTVGVVAGVLMLDAKSTLDEECRATCPQSAESDLSRFRTMRTVSAVGYVTGAVGVAAGAALLLIAGSSSTDTASTHVRPFVGVRSAGVEGAF